MAGLPSLYGDHDRRDEDVLSDLGTSPGLYPRIVVGILVSGGPNHQDPRIALGCSLDVDPLWCEEALIPGQGLCLDFEQYAGLDDD